MNEKLQELKKELENIEITYDYEASYCKLRNATIDFMNDTQEFFLDGFFENYLDEKTLEYMVEYNLKEHGLWAVQNLLSGVKQYEGIYVVDASGYGHDITYNELEDLKSELIFEVESRLKED